MIDLENAKKEFKKYVNTYDSENPKIAKKIAHSYRVIEVADKIAKSLELSNEDVQLAKLIALLHDIGRFEQLKIYDTFSDKDSIDHADFGVDVLFKNNLIRNFIKENTFDNIIFKAIKNHNKYKIEDGLNERELLHAKIIRDADKTDIYRLYIIDLEQNENVIFDYDKIAKEKINQKVLDSIKANKLVNSYNVLNGADSYARALAFIFDYNFVEGLRIVKHEHYIQKLIDRIRTKDNPNNLDEIQNIICTYMDKRIA